MILLKTVISARNMSAWQIELLIEQIAVLSEQIKNERQLAITFHEGVL